MYYDILIRQKEKDFKNLKVTTKENLIKCLNNLLNYEFRKDHNLELHTQKYITFKHFVINVTDNNEKKIKKIVITKYKNKYYFEKYNKN